MVDREFWMTYIAIIPPITRRYWGTICMMVLCAIAMVVIPVSYGYANPKYASLVVDASNGEVIHQKYAGKSRYPASLTKLMTLYLTFEAIEQGELRMNQRIRVSQQAAKQPPSKLGLRKGSTIRVKEAVLSLIVKSANDAAVVLAEAVSGSEKAFARKMTSTARALGMKHTTFRNASGLPHRQQRTTAYDMARLAIALRRDYPQYYHLFDRSSFRFNKRTYRSHNRVSMYYKGADGLKTGFINASGYNLITSAKRDGRRLVAVVMGGRTSKRRDRHMVNLLDRSFAQLAAGKVKRYNLRISARSLKRYIPTPTLKPGGVGMKEIQFASHLPTSRRNKTYPHPVLKPKGGHLVITMRDDHHERYDEIDIPSYSNRRKGTIPTPYFKPDYSYAQGSR